MSDSRLILHVKGTENQTTELPKQIVRAGIAQGQITRSQLIWSAAHNAWKQVRELPHLLPSQKLAPPPPSRLPTGPVPKVAGHESAPTGSAPRVASGVRAATGAVPRVAGAESASSGGAPKVAIKAGAGRGIPVAQAASVAQTAAHARAAAHHVVKEEADGFHPMKWFCIILGVLILAVIGFNYFMVDQPLIANLAQTPYATKPVYGHLGAFVQPKALVIHVVGPSLTTDSDLIKFLHALAHSTPDSPMSQSPFDYISLTTGWTGQFTFSGYAWKQFGDMGQDDEAAQEDFLLDQLRDASGQNMVSPKGQLDPSAEQAERQKVWEKFSAYFTKS